MQWSTKILDSLDFGLFVLTPIIVIGIIWSMVSFVFGYLLPAIRSRPKPSDVPSAPSPSLPASSKLALIRIVNEETKASVGLCKRALEEADYDVQKAITLLQVASSPKTYKQLQHGRVHSAVFGNVAVILEVNCETSFASQQPQFGMFVTDLAMQIAVGNPQLIGRDHVGPALDPFSSIPPPPPSPDESILLQQVSVIPDHKGKTVQQLLTELSDRLGEQVVIRRFARYELGA